MKHYLLLLFALASHLAFAQNKTTITVGHAYELPSESLGENVTIQVSTPDAYNDADESYPVLYMLDGQWFFLDGLSVRAEYTQRNGTGRTPEFIVVAIKTDNSKRWEWTVERSSEFLTFIENELIPFLGQNYRTTSERFLFGWEATGGFVIHALVHKPELFQAYLAGSPTPLYGTYFPNLAKEYAETKDFLIRAQYQNKYLYIGESETDFPVQYGVDSLVALLSEHATDELRWRHDRMVGVSHPMTGYHTLFQGLKDYYSYYHPLSYISKLQFETLGGLKYIDSFYKERAKLGVVNDEASKHQTQRSLTLTAISEDDFAWFDSLFNHFESDSLLEKSFPPHINVYARYYLKYGRKSDALKILTFLLEKYPDQAQGYNSLGDYFLVSHDSAQAKLNYERAIEIGTENDDWRLEGYKSDLDRLIMNSSN